MTEVYYSPGPRVPRHAVDGLPELTAAIERLAAAFEPPPTAHVWPAPTVVDNDDPATWPRYKKRVLVDLGDGWFVAALGDGLWVEDPGLPIGAVRTGHRWLPLPDDGDDTDA